jgi:hypothetical protein
MPFLFEKRDNFFMYPQYKEKTGKLQEKIRSYFEKKVLQFPEESYIIHAKLINI